MGGKIIATIISLITLVGAAFTVDGLYVRKANAAEKYSQQLAGQERDRIEVELQVIQLELEFLNTQYADVSLSDLGREKLRDRRQYLRKRQEVLEARLLVLRDKL